MDPVPIGTDTGARAVLELIYRLKVRDVMTADVVTAPPQASMRELQRLMRENSITGLPIVKGRLLSGIVSIDDIIQALDGGRMEEPASSMMSRDVIVLEDDMPLTFAISYLNRYGFGRFPVVDRERAVVGIVTATDIVRRLLVEMNREVERLEEELCSRSAPGDGRARLSFPTVRHGFQNAGRASAEFKKALKELGIDAGVARRAAVAAYELELNQVIHSEGGSISMEAGEGRIEIVARDSGPGIPDTEAALREGFSTADEWVRSLGFGAGMGLPNAKRVADEFDLDSGPGRGTAVRVVIFYNTGSPA